MKLGLVIKITSGGVSEAFSINKEEEWSRSTDDVRTAISCLGNFDGTGKTVLLTKFLGSKGYLLAVIKARPEGSGRSGDNTAAWIHIPATCDVSNVEVLTIIEAVESAISASKGIEIASLNEVFDREYNTNDVLQSAASTIVSKDDSNFGLRYYNKDYTLKELLGISVAQQEYSMYKGIFFVDAKSAIGISVQSQCKELNFEPRAICSFLPPRTTDGFQAYVKVQDLLVPFNKMIEVPEGSRISVHWEKSDYSPIVKTFIAQGDSSIEKARISPSEYKVIIKRSLFKVTDESGNYVKNYRIHINGKSMSGDSMEMSEDDFKQGVQLEITAEGYSSKKEKSIQLQLNAQKKIKLTRKLYHYEFEIPAYDGDRELSNRALVTIETRSKLSDSPVKGYTLDGDIREGENSYNRLSYKGGDEIFTKVKNIGIGFACCLACFLLYAGWQALDEYEFNLGWPPFTKPVKIMQDGGSVEKKETPESTNSGSEDVVDDAKQTKEEQLEKEIKDPMAAVQYLNTQDKWNKNELEKYEDTKGLFDELNTYDFEKIIDRAGRLKSATKLQELVNVLKKYPGKTIKGPYNSEGDIVITIDVYIQKLQLKLDEEKKKIEDISISGNSANSGQNNRNQRQPGQQNPQGTSTVIPKIGRGAI